MCMSCVFMCKDSIYAWTQTHICTQPNFIGKLIKNKVFYNFKTVFNLYDLLSVDMLDSVVIGFSAILLSCLCITSPHWKEFSMHKFHNPCNFTCTNVFTHLCLHIQISYVCIHLCPIAMKISTREKLKVWKTQFPLFCFVWSLWFLDNSLICFNAFQEILVQAINPRAIPARINSLFVKYHPLLT